MIIKQPANEPVRYRGMLVTDFDGTLRRKDGTFHERDIQTLMTLECQGIMRVIATGRSPYSFYGSVPSDFPIDYLVFSSGTGVIRWSDKTLIRQLNLPDREVEPTISFLMKNGFDFMIHDSVPENHGFQFYKATQNNSDFQHRIDIYSPFARPLDKSKRSLGPCAQFVVIVGKNGPETYDCLKSELKKLSVIRTTSPLDHHSVWIEIFHPDVSKSRTSAWLAEKNNIARENVVCIGNDYNDLDLLEWAGQAFMVGNAPPELSRRFSSVSSNDEAGVSDAVERWTLSG